MRKLCNFIGKHKAATLIKLIVGTAQNYIKL